MIIDPHELSPPGDGADRKTATDDLGQRRKIRVDAEQRLSTTGVGSERDHFVQDENRTDLPGHPLDHCDERLGYLDKTQIAGSRIEKDGCDGAGMCTYDALGRLDIVEGDDDDVVGHALGHPFRVTDRIRVISPVRRRRIEADLGVIIRPMINALEIGRASCRERV